MIELQIIKCNEQLGAKLQKILEVLSNLFGNKSQPYQRKSLKIFDLEALSFSPNSRESKLCLWMLAF